MVHLRFCTQALKGRSRNNLKYKQHTSTHTHVHAYSGVHAYRGAHAHAYASAQAYEFIGAGMHKCIRAHMHTRRYGVARKAERDAQTHRCLGAYNA